MVLQQLLRSSFCEQSRTGPSKTRLLNRQAMYAYFHETERRFFEGMCTLRDQARISSDLPPPCHSWIASCQSCIRLTRLLPLATANVYSLLPYLVLGNKLQSGEKAILRSHWGRLCKIVDIDFREFTFHALR